MTNIKGRINLSNISRILSATAGLVLAVFLAVVCVTDNTTAWKSRPDGDFFRVRDLSCREIVCADTPIGVVKEYTFALREALDGEAHLAFYTVHQYVDVYLNETHVYSLKPSGDFRLSKSVGSHWVMIPLYSEDAGKEVRVDITPVYESFRNREVEFFVGSQLAVYVDRLSKDLPQLILGMIAVLAGFVFLCVAAYHLIRKHRKDGLAAIGLFMIIMGLWRLTDTRFTPFIIHGKPVFLFYVSVAMLMFGMIPIVKSMEERPHVISGRLIDIYCIAAALLCLVQLVFQICGVQDIRESLFITHAVIAVGAGLLLFDVIVERLKYPKNYVQQGERKFLIICVAGALADVVAYYVRGTSSGLLFSLTALLIYLVLTGIYMMIRYSEQEKKLAEKDRLLTESRIATMISQIQPHFIYNSLNSIYHLCEKDAHLAQQAISNFSDYLQRSLRVIDCKARIPFEEELSHVKAYLKLEQMRFEEAVNVVYRIETTAFSVPALSVQPLVENAVKHGLCPKDDGGTIIITVRERPACYEIIVSDDGVGFDPEDMNKGNGAHIGIQNVRQRLQMMCNATLEIASEPGKGTTSLIRMPKETNI